MKNVNETKLEALNVAKQYNAGDLDELLNNAQKVLNFLEYYVGDCPNKLEEKREKFINVVNSRLNQFEYKDPLKKEYARHAIVSQYIDERLRNGISELCKQIDEEVGEEYAKVNSEYKPDEKLAEVFMKGLVPSTNPFLKTSPDATFSSGEYVSPDDQSKVSASYEYNNSKRPERGLILTEREEIDKKILKELIDNLSEDKKASCKKDDTETHLVDAFIKARADVSKTPMIIESPNIKPFTDIRNIENDCFAKMVEITKQ